MRSYYFTQCTSVQSHVFHIFFIPGLLVGPRKRVEQSFAEQKLKCKYVWLRCHQMLSVANGSIMNFVVTKHTEINGKQICHYWSEDMKSIWYKWPVTCAQVYVDSTEVKRRALQGRNCIGVPSIILQSVRAPDRAKLAGTRTVAAVHTQDTWSHTVAAVQWPQCTLWTHGLPPWLVESGMERWPEQCYEGGSVSCDTLHCTHIQD